MKIDEFAPLAKSALTALKSLGGSTASTIAKNLKPKSGGTNMIGRTPGQDKGNGGAFSGNPPKNSLGSIGAMPGAKTSSIGTGNNSSDSPTTTDDTTPGTDDPVGPQSAADMRDSESNEIDTGSAFTAGTQNMQNAQSNTVEPEELKSGDKVTVEVPPGDKNLKLVYPDKTEVLVPRELLRLQQLAGMQNET